MRLEELRVGGAYSVSTVTYADSRGLFLEWFSEPAFASATGRPLPLRQANCSVSRRGTVRGLHFADVPPGQAKYVTCLHGSVLDVVLDVRQGSPTFGTWDTVQLDDLDRRAVYIPEGVAHAFVALSDQAVVSYLCSEPYAPSREHGIDPLDPALGIDWPLPHEQLVLSEKDRAAPTLEQWQKEGGLPSFTECQKWYASTRLPGDRP